MLTASEPVGEAKSGSPEMPEWLSSLKSDAHVLTLVSEAVSESGDFHLRVVFWGVLLKIIQKFQNELVMAGDQKDSQRYDCLKQMIHQGLMVSDDLLRNPTGLNKEKVGISVEDVRVNVEWLHEKLMLLDTKILPQRRDFLLKALAGGKSEAA
jgi:hypothetical protein